jgi:hypothetical protein
MCQLYVCGHAQWKAPFQVSTVPLYADCLFVYLFVCFFVCLFTALVAEKQNNVFCERDTVQSGKCH